jgi:hypothetical protein
VIYYNFSKLIQGLICPVLESLRGKKSIFIGWVVMCSSPRRLRDETDFFHHRCHHPCQERRDPAARGLLPGCSPTAASRRHPRERQARADAASRKVCGGERNSATAASRRRVFIATADTQSRTRKWNRKEVTDRCAPPPPSE